MVIIFNGIICQFSFILRYSVESTTLFSLSPLFRILSLSPSFYLSLSLSFSISISRCPPHQSSFHTNSTDSIIVLGLFSPHFKFCASIFLGLKFPILLMSSMMCIRIDCWRTQRLPIMILCFDFFRPILSPSFVRFSNCFDSSFLFWSFGFCCVRSCMAWDFWEC